MGRWTERAQDSQLSVWTLDPAEQRTSAPGWLASLSEWRRRHQRQPVRQARPASPADAARGESTTLPEAGRGQALRLAHRALRDRMRTQRELRRVLPHLYFIERSLARQGSASLMDMPVWVLQRGLQQLSRLPADSLDERVTFSVLQQRLVEAIQMRSIAAARKGDQVESPDSFMGGLDSQMGSRSAFNTSPGGLDVTEVPRSAYDDLVQGRLPGRPDAANTSGWRRS